MKVARAPLGRQPSPTTYGRVRVVARSRSASGLAEAPPEVSFGSFPARTAQREHRSLQRLQLQLYGPKMGAYLSDTIVDFVVWGCRPTGYVDQETARWLEALLRVNQTKAARQILGEVRPRALTKFSGTRCLPAASRPSGPQTS